MTQEREEKRAGGIGDAAVRAATGKGWDEWFTLLDAAGAMDMDHQGIVAHLAREHGLPGWWQQMVTVAYEQERGKRAKHQVASGYQVSVTKTVAVSASRLFEAWQDKGQRRRWLGEVAIEMRRATQDKSMRIIWSPDGTSLDVNFYAKGEGKSQVSLEHSKLADPQAAERMKAFWHEALERLKRTLEDA